MEYKNGRLLFENVIQLQLDNMIRDKVILSIESFFQKLFRICKTRRSLDTISNKLGLDKGFEMIGEVVLDILSNNAKKIYVQEKYFCIENCSPKKCDNMFCIGYRVLFDEHLTVYNIGEDIRQLGS